MAAVSHRMETSDDFGRPVSFHAPGLSSTSGEGEGEGEKGGYNFTARRKNRRKTITLNDTQRLPTGTQSLSESAFGTPSPSLFSAALPPSRLRLQTSFNPLDYNAVVQSPTPQSSPRRTSGRNTINSSPVKKQAGVLPGVAMANNDTIAADVLKELERGRGRGIPRTLTLPAHLTESLMKMKITRERDGSADLMVAHPDIMGQEGTEKVEKDGMDIDGMEVDDGTAASRKLKPKLFVHTQSPETTIQPEQKTPPPRSPRKGKGKGRRARSAPPRQRTNPDADACDGDDEDGGTNDEGDDTGPLSPAPAPRRRGRQDATSAMGLDEEPMELTMPGMAPITSSVLRRSARRVKPGSTAIGMGGAERFLKGIVEGDAGSGMEMADVMVKVGSSRKRARTREADVGSGMEVEVVVPSRGSERPRKRARTREGGDREKERGRDEEGRATKRTRKR